MNKSVVSPRYNIFNLETKIDVAEAQLEDLAESYDMYREVHGPRPVVIAYAFLEHILRVTTSAEDEQACMSCITSSELRQVVDELLLEKHKVSVQSAMGNLEKLVAH